MTQFWSLALEAIDVGGNPYTGHISIPLNAGNVLITCHLTRVVPNAISGISEIFISQYVQNGQDNTGSWDVIAGEGITEVYFSLYANSAQVKGTGLVITL